VSVFGKQAETCAQYLRKGSKVYVEGRMQADPKTGGPRIWTGQDGAPRASFEVTGNTVKFLSSRGEGGGGAGGTAPMHEPDAVMAEDSDDIPF
jgi:single-strand DNA-binding protein